MTPAVTYLTRPGVWNFTHKISLALMKTKVLGYGLLIRASGNGSQALEARGALVDSVYRDRVACCRELSRHRTSYIQQKVYK